MNHKIILRRLFSGVCFLAIWISPVAFGQAYRLLTPEIMELGRVIEGQTLEGDVRFINTGNSPLRILGVRTSCGCTAARPQNTDVSAQDTAVVHFTLRTGGFHGLIRKMLTVDFENQTTSDLVVTIQATVFSELEVKPTFLSFQSVSLRKDTTVTDSLAFLNTSNRPVRISNIRCDSEEIIVDFQPFSILPNRKISIPIVLKPRKTEYQHATITIETDSASKPIIRIPVLFDIVE